MQDPSEKRPSGNEKETAKGSQLEIKTKDGKLIVAPPNIDAGISSDKPEQHGPQKTKSLEIETKKGKLIVTTITDEKSDKLENIILERKTADTPSKLPKASQQHQTSRAPESSKSSPVTHAQSPQNPTDMEPLVLSKSTEAVNENVTTAKPTTEEIKKTKVRTV